MGFLSSVAGVLANPMVATGALGGASSALSYIGQKKTNEMNRDVAMSTNAMSERLSSTAYQRGMADMKKAGLNPILAGKLGGASTPGLNMPQFNSELGAGVQGGLQGLSTAADVRKKHADTALTKAHTVLSENLIPGSEAISTITKAAAELIEYIDKIIRNQTGGYGNAVNESIKALQGLKEKAKGMGPGTFGAVNNFIIKKVLEAEHSVREFLNDFTKKDSISFTRD